MLTGKQSQDESESDGELLSAFSARKPRGQTRILQINPDVFSESDARQRVSGARARVMLQPSLRQTPQSGQLCKVHQFRNVRAYGRFGLFQFSDRTHHRSGRDADLLLRSTPRPFLSGRNKFRLLANVRNRA